jgi:hypothetical protein
MCPTFRKSPPEAAAPDGERHNRAYTFEAISAPPPGARRFRFREIFPSLGMLARNLQFRLQKYSCH